jgi:hypothetical protein
LLFENNWRLKMRKGVLVLIIALAVTLTAAAQNYSVETVTGRVQRVSGTNRVDVKEGDILTADTVIQTGVGASLVLKQGEDTFTIPAARNGNLGELITTASGVRINGNVARVDTAAAARTTGQVTTASARASDAAEDEDIAAE